jgi:hypothetical protein
MSLSIENQGLYERAVARDAKKLSKTPEEMRRILSVNATATVMSMLGPAPDSKSVGAAFAKFAAKPGKLNVSVKAKNASGVLVSRFGDSGTARSGLAEQFEISATAE